MGQQSAKVLRDLDFSTPIDPKVARVLWKKYDTNKDGTLDEGEFRFLVADWAKQHNIADVDGQFNQIWNSFEKDKDGHLQRDVFLGQKRVRAKSKLGEIAQPTPETKTETTQAQPPTTTATTETKQPETKQPESTAAAAATATTTATTTAAATTTTTTPFSSANTTIPNPVRMLLSSYFGKFEATGVPCFENLPEGSYQDFEFSDYEANIYKDTAVISWRWMKPKPPNLETARDGEKCPVPPALVPYMAEKAQREGIKYLWLDWSCAPQYPVNDPTATMREINRSGKYYASARGFYVWCYDGPVKGIDFAHSDYFFRAWTLSERLHRARSAGALTAAHFLPFEVHSLLSEESVLAVPKPANSVWGPVVAKICATMNISIVSTGGLSAPSLTTILDLVSTRLPPFQKTVAALNGSFKTVLEPQVHAAMVLCVQLACFSHWIKYPFSDDNMCMMFRMSPIQFKQALLQEAINRARQIMNNFRNSNLNEVLEQINIREASEASVSTILGPVGELWKRALASPTAEKPASSAFLRRFLSFEADCTYKAFSKPDLLFAIYKLFDIGDFAYGQELALYRALVEKAGLPYICTGEPYAWLKELALITDNESEIVGSQLKTQKNNRSNKDSATSSTNFSIFSYDISSPHTREQALSIPKIFCAEAFLEATPGVMNVLLGFKMNSRAQLAMQAKGKAFTQVDKSTGGEMDSHLSLRGRQALSLFENRLHAALQEHFATGAYSQPSGLFIFLRYGTFSCLTKCVIMRAQYIPTDEQWSLESVSAFGSEPQKGSSFGVAKSLDCLIKDIRALDGQTSVSGIVEGEPTGSSFVRPMHLDPEDWLFATPLSLTPQPEPTIVTSAPEEVKQPVEETKQAASSQSPEQAARAAAEKEDGSFAMPRGKTSFTEADLELVERAFLWGLKQGFNSESLTKYFLIIDSNYVHDSLMAKQLGYFTKLCIMLARHVTIEKDLLSVAQLRQKFDYMAEDLSDAIDMADDESLQDPARKALSALNQAMED